MACCSKKWLLEAETVLVSVRHFGIGTGAKLSGHFGTSLVQNVLGPKCTRSEVS